jgi:predicted lipid-binding transport protein (Tim44 family)
MSDTPQFGTAEYHPQPGVNLCKTCGKAIAEQYYRVSGAITCPVCVERARASLPADSSQAYSRGLMFGIGGALLGLILYSTVGIVTGLSIGYVSLAVGYIVGRAMMMGSRNMGGRRYQIAAAVLTYAAVSISAVPIGLSQMIKTEKSKTSVAQPAGKTEVPVSTAANTASDPPQVASVGFVAAIGTLALLGLASPVMELADPLQGLIGLVILFVGIRIAWKSTAGSAIPISGPFKT